MRTQPSAVHTSITESKLSRFTNDTPKDRFIRDTNLRGFGVRVSPNNVKSYFAEATVQGRFVRKVLGRHPLIPLSEARKTALQALRELRYGVDTSRTPSNKNDCLFLDLAKSFIADKEATLRATTLRDYRAILLTGPYFRSWHDRAVTSISRREVLERYRELCPDHGVPTANRCMRVLSVLFNYSKAIYPELEDWGNPVRVLAEARAKRPVRPRTTFIPLDQLGGWLSSLEQYRTAPRRPQEETARRNDVWLLLHLLLMTGLRSNEARSLKWSDIDLDAGTLTIRAELAKNHRQAILPLNSWLVERLLKRDKSGTYVFGASRICGYLGNLRRPLAELRERSGLTIAPHDLRRTYATYLDFVGAPFGVIKQLLNHVSGSDVTSQYVQQRGMEELRIYSERVLGLIDARRIQCTSITD